MKRKNTGKALGGHARAAVLSGEERRAVAKKAAQARWDKAKDIPQTEYSGKLVIGEMEFPCSVLSDGTRILTQSDFMQGMGMYYSGWVSRNRSEEDTAADVPQFLSFKSLKPFVDKHLGDLHSITVSYRTERGAIARGIKAEIIPKICDVWLDAAELGKLGIRQERIAANAKLIMRALAHTGIIALVDEATGYQRVRASDALSKILQAFIAKELQPWIHTFPDDFYEQLFRLRGLEYPRDTVQKPQYFGHLTNDIVYKRLAPGVLEELKNTTPKSASGRHKEQLHRRLTPELGHPKLMSRLEAVVAMMKLSVDYEDFKHKIDRIYPKYGETIEMMLDEPKTGL